MKRFSAREFALLCSPLLFVGVVGWLLSRRSPDEGKLHLEFRVEKPPVLAAFDGADAALVVELKGPNTQGGSSTNAMRIGHNEPFLEMQTAKGVQKAPFGSASGFWRDVWKSGLNNTYYINSRPIPAGTLRFGTNAALWPITSPRPSGKIPRVSGLWAVNRAQIQPFPFDKMPRLPLIKIDSIKVTQVKTFKKTTVVTGEILFQLMGEKMNDQTPWVYDVRGNNSLTAQQRGIQWSATSSLSSISQPISGRVSADERWPLAFEFEPFDFAKAKVGQKLKFKTWPAQLPKP